MKIFEIDDSEFLRKEKKSKINRLRHIYIKKE
jgi:hypothetical protein